MTSPSSPSHTHTIPTEVISDEEMALIEAAFAAASRSYSSSLLSPSIRSVSPVLNRPFVSKPGSYDPDIEDFGSKTISDDNDSLLRRFRRNKALSVTDVTSSEWCEKQMEFCLLFGKPEATKAMKAGTSRHTELEEEVLKRVIVQTKTTEDVWALKFMNFLTGVNQLLFDGMTRELPLIGFVEGIWMIGIIDEIRMPVTDNEKSPILVDTKTRMHATLPSEAQRRNGRLQLMCYKHLWDSVVGTNFPSRQFVDFFSLDPKCILSEEIREMTANSGFPTETLDDLIGYFQNSCSILSPAHDQLLLRYELQRDRSLLDEDQFTYDEKWVKGKLEHNLEFWQGKREADYTAKEERWKCNFCKFSSVCPSNSIPVDSPK